MSSALRIRLLVGAATLGVVGVVDAAPAFAQAAPTPYTSATRYDALGRVTGSISPDPDGVSPFTFIAVRNTYDPSGNLTKVEKGVLSGWQAETVAPASWTGFTIDTTVESTFDAMGRKLSDRVKDASLVTVSLTQSSYTPAGSVECTALRMNPAAFASPPASACALGTPATINGVTVNDRITKNTYTVGDPTRLVKVQQGVGTAAQRDYVAYAYTANGKQASVTDARGLKASYVYDGFDRLKEWHFPDPSFAQTASATDYESYSYDANGNVTERRLRDDTAAAPSRLAFTFDALNRQTSRTPTAEATVYSYYDLRGLKTMDQATDGRLVTYTWDGLGRLLTENQPGSGVMTYKYDLNGNRKEVNWGDGFLVRYDYDQLDRPTAIRENGVTSGIGVLASYAYTADGKRSQVTYGNGTARLFQYDTAGRTTGVKLDLAGTADDLVIGQVAAEGAPVLYNPAGQIVSLARSNDAYAWTAHALFERDYAVNGLNQYTSAGAASFAYDGRGNLTQSGTSAYGYTRLNELKTAPNLSGGTVTLGYDTSGRLSQYTAAGSTIAMLYSGPSLVGEIGAAGALVRRYVHSPGTDEPVVWYEGAGTADRRWLQADQLGSIAAVSDGSGAMLGINRYDEYGIPQSGNIGRFQYTGQTWFGEIGLYNYKARWYSASLGRFMQVDPIGYKDNLNLYAYVGNDPVNRTDPTGLKAMLEDETTRAQTAVRQGRQTDVQIASRAEKGERRESGGRVIGTVGEARGALAKAAGATTVVQKVAVGAAPVAIKVGAAGLQVQGQIDQGKSPGAATANVAGQTATSGIVGGLTGAGLGALGANPLTVVLGGIAGSVGADLSGLSNKGGELAERFYEGLRSAAPSNPPPPFAYYP